MICFKINTYTSGIKLKKCWSVEPRVQRSRTALTMAASCRSARRPPEGAMGANWRTWGQLCALDTPSWLKLPYACEFNTPRARWSFQYTSPQQLWVVPKWGVSLGPPHTVLTTLQTRREAGDISNRSEAQDVAHEQASITQGQRVLQAEPREDVLTVKAGER